MRCLWIALVLVSGHTFAGQMYVCTDATGKKSFQDQPCAGAVKSEVKPVEAAPVVGFSPGTGGDTYNQMRVNNRNAELGYDVKRSEERIEQYQVRMQRELAALQARKASANNNLAGATYLQSLSTEMQAVTAKYTGLVDIERARIDTLRRDMDRP